jgi:Na+/melibiose symporter-like transporter
LNFDQWSTWKRALVLNVLGAVGVAAGFAWSGAKLPPKYSVPVIVFILAYLNFLFLVIRPRILAAKAAGTPKIDTLRQLASVVCERPLIILLIIFQLIAISRSLTSAVTLIYLAGGEYVRHVPYAPSVRFRTIAMSVMMTVIAGIWLLGAVGLWRKRRWGWWLALVLNGLAAGVSALVQVLNTRSYLLDAVATSAVILLLLPTVRKQFRGSPRLNCGGNFAASISGDK